jgi:hypothetical protein
MLHRRLKDGARLPAVAATFACPSYEDLRVRSAILAYVVGESYHDLTILDLAVELSPTDDSDAVERAVRDLVGEELLSIDGGKVVPGQTWTMDLLSQ